MNEHLSKKIKYLSFISMIWVVFTHAYNYADDFLEPTTIITEGTKPWTMIQFLISNNLSSLAVPLFFTISGYLFFRNYEPTLEGYVTKLRSRTKSLLIPLMIWTILSGVFLVILNQIGFDFVGIVNAHATSFFENGLWGWFKMYSVPAFQLWFLQQLFSLIIIAPITYVIIKHTKLLPFLAFVLFVALRLPEVIQEQGLFYNYNATAYFLLGSYFGIHKKNELINRRFSKKVAFSVLFAWLGLGILRTYFCATWSPDWKLGAWILHEMFYILVFLGVVATWICFEHFIDTSKEHKWLDLCAANGIFIFLMQEPLLHVCFQIIMHYVSSDFAHTICFFGLSIIICVLCIATSELLRRHAKKLHSILTGGR